MKSSYNLVELENAAEHAAHWESGYDWLMDVKKGQLLEDRLPAHIQETCTSMAQTAVRFIESYCLGGKLLQSVCNCAETAYECVRECLDPDHQLHSDMERYWAIHECLVRAAEAKARSATN